MKSLTNLPGLCLLGQTHIKHLIVLEKSESSEIKKRPAGGGTRLPTPAALGKAKLQVMHTQTNFSLDHRRLTIWSIFCLPRGSVCETSQNCPKRT